MQAQSTDIAEGDVSLVIADAIKELAAALNSSTDGTSWLDVLPLAIAFLTVLVMAATIFFNYKTVVRTLRQTTGREFGKVLLQYRIDQLNDLYGPIMMLNGESKATYAKLIENKPEKWHVLLNISEVLANPTDMQLMESIMKANDEIVRLLREKAGMAYKSELPESFELFLKHQNLIKAAMSEKPMPDIKKTDVFPKQFDKDVQAHYEEIRRDIEWIIEKSRSKMERALID